MSDALIHMIDELTDALSDPEQLSLTDERRDASLRLHAALSRWADIRTKSAEDAAIDCMEAWMDACHHEDTHRVQPLKDECAMLRAELESLNGISGGGND